MVLTKTHHLPGKQVSRLPSHGACALGAFPWGSSCWSLRSGDPRPREPGALPMWPGGLKHGFTGSEDTSRPLTAVFR